MLKFKAHILKCYFIGFHLIKNIIPKKKKNQFIHSKHKVLGSIEVKRLILWSCDITER